MQNEYNSFEIVVFKEFNFLIMCCNSVVYGVNFAILKHCFHFLI